MCAVNRTLAPRLRGKDAKDRNGCDRTMIEMDRTFDKGKLSGRPVYAGISVFKARKKSPRQCRQKSVAHRSGTS
ncbi:MAG: hypothetical protein ACE5HC_09165 [Candidatus Binatia bacterium]